jgi:hypothetical protein
MKIMKTVLTEINRLEPENAVTLSPIQIYSTTLSIAVTLPNREDLYEVFDQFVPSVEMPFCVLAVREVVYTKLYSNIVPPSSWTHLKKPQNGLYFFLLNSPKGNVTSRINRILENAGMYRDEEHIIVTRHYSKCVWTPENRIEIEVVAPSSSLEPPTLGEPRPRSSTSPTKMIKKLSLERLKSSLPELQFEVVLKHQSRLRGVTQLAGRDLYVLPFFDSVTNQEIFRQFLFLYERRSSIGASQKGLERPTVYFSWDAQSQEKTLGSISLQLNLSKELVDVTFTRARSKREVEVALQIFRVLLLLSYFERKKITKQYLMFLQSSQLPTSLKLQKKVTYGKNIGERADALKEARHDLFTEGYASKCGKKQQPRLVNTEQAAVLQKQFAKNFQTQGVEEYLEKAQHKLINYPIGSDDWYVCDPREPGDPIPGHVWPGLMVNKIAENKSSAPYLPCCYVVDHYTRPRSHLNRYLAQEKAKKKPVEGEGGYELGPDKLLDLGRIGKVPYYLGRLLEVNCQDQASYYRLGVDHSPDSFLKCLLFALGKYDPLSSPVQFIQKFKISLSTKIVAPLKQTLYEHDTESLREILRDPTSFIDPDVFLPLFEYTFGLNIYLVERSDMYPAGRLLVPRHHPFTQYLFAPRDRPTVIIVKYDSISSKERSHTSQLRREDSPFQCEVVTEQIAQGEFKKVFAAGEAVSVRMRQAFGLVNHTTQISQLQIEGRGALVTEVISEDYTSLFTTLGSTITKQTIDQYGKTRVLWVDDTPIITPPLPVLFIEERESDPSSGWPVAQARTYCKLHKLPIVAQAVSERQVKGLWAAMNRVLLYFPLSKESSIPPFPDVEVTFQTPTLSSAEGDGAASQLAKFRRGRLLAQYLLQHAFYGFSRYLNAHRTSMSDQEAVDAFFEQSIVDPALVYPHGFSKTKRLAMEPPYFVGDRLVVESERIKSKLRSNLLVKLINDPLEIYGYQDRFIVKITYSRIDDFLAHPNQILFLNEAALFVWRRHLKDNINAQGNLTSRTIYSTILDLSYREPYFFQHPAVANRLCLLQNVFDSSLERAATVSQRWVERHYNLGYFAGIGGQVSKQLKVLYYGNFLSENEITDTTVPVIEWRGDEGIKYIAVLFVDVSK